MSFILWQLCILQPQVAADICCLLGATSVNLIHWTEVFNDVWDVDTNYVTIISQAITLLVLKTCPVFRQSLKQLLPFYLSSQEKTVKMAHCWSKVRISITEKKDIFISTKKKKSLLRVLLKYSPASVRIHFSKRKKSLLISSSSTHFSPLMYVKEYLPRTTFPDRLQTETHSQLRLLNHRDGFKGPSRGWLGFIMANETPHYSLLSYNKCL